MTKSADRSGGKFGGTDRNLESYSRAASRTLDRTSIETHGIPGLILMEHASIGIALAILDLLDNLQAASPASPQTGPTAKTEPAPQNGRVEILCGPGNNGGDGLAVARHLWNAAVPVTVWDLVPVGARPEGSDAALQCTIARGMGIEILDASEQLPPESDPLPTLRVDALFGTGLSRPPEGILRAAIESLNRSPVPVLAVDLPSGLDADRGVPLGLAVEAAETVTLGIPKIGFLTPRAERFTGALRCVPIGAPRQLLPGGIPAFPPAPHRVDHTLGAGPPESAGFQIEPVRECRENEQTRNEGPAS